MDTILWQTDGRTDDQGKNNMFPNPTGGRHKYWIWVIWTRSWPLVLIKLSYSWLHLPTFISQTTTVSEKSIVLTVSHTKAKPYMGSNLTLPLKRSRSTQGHHLNKLGSTRVPDAAYKFSRSSAFWFQRRRIFHVFTIYGNGGHLGHVPWTIWTNLFPHPTEAPHEIWLLSV